MILGQYNRSLAHSCVSTQVQVKRISSIRKATCKATCLAMENTQGLLLKAWETHIVKNSTIPLVGKYSRCTISLLLVSSKS